MKRLALALLLASLCGCATLDAVSQWWIDHVDVAAVTPPPVVVTPPQPPPGPGPDVPPVVVPPETSEPEPKPPAANGDDLDLSRVTNFILPNTPGVTAGKIRSAAVTAKITAASTDGRRLVTKYERYSWPTREGLDAICHFFYESGGTVMGGKFDWWRAGGQGTKGLENVHDGYGGHRMPAKGTPCWTMFSSLDGTQRSNTRRVTW